MSYKNKEERKNYYKMYQRERRKDPTYRKNEYQYQRQWWANIKAQVLAMRAERARHD